MRTLGDERDRGLLLARLRSFRIDSPRRWGRMTSHQMVCHLSDNFRMALGSRSVARMRAFVPGALVKWGALYTPIPWPRGLATSPEADQEGGGTRPVEFGADLAEAVALFDQVASDTAVLAPAHPLFGAMTTADWHRWGYLHTDHHLRQFGA